LLISLFVCLSCFVVNKVGKNLQVTTGEGLRLADVIKAAKYCECSALNNEGVRTMFETAVRLTLKPQTAKRKRSRTRCILL